MVVNKINDIADLTDAAAEPALITEMRSRIKDQTATIARLEADNARHTEPLAENFQVPKVAAYMVGKPRQTLEYWVAHGKVKHFYDAHGQLWIDVVDGRRQRFLLAPGGLANLGIAPGAMTSDR